MTVTNTLAHTSTVLITAVKSLITQAPDVKVIRLLIWSKAVVSYSVRPRQALLD
jgi:hypothetical protein